MFAAQLLDLLRRNADYRRLFFSTVISFMGDWFAFVAASGMVADVTGRGGLAALVYAANVLPAFLLSPVAGAVADRVDRKKLFIAADLLRVVPALGMIAALRLESPALMIGCEAAIAALSAFSEPIHAAVVPNLVEAKDLSLAQAALGSVWGSMLFLGAAVGGLVSATLGRDATFLFNALTFVASAYLLVRIKRPLQRALPTGSPSFWRELREVWHLARARQTTRALFVTKTGVGLANGIVGLLPAFAVARFGKGDAGVGILLAARGLGALIGPFLGRHLARDDGRRIFLVCGGSIITYGIAYAFLPLSTDLQLAAACVVLAHVGGGAQWTLSTYGLQLTTPDEMRGRVMGIDFGLATLAIGISALLAGGTTELVGLERASWGMAAVALLYGISWLYWTRHLWQARTDPLVVGRREHDPA